MPLHVRQRHTRTKAEAVGKAVQGIVNLNIVTLAQTKAADLNGGDQEAHANARLYADAHNTANACDMLPNELLAKLREAEDLLQQAVSYSMDAGRYGDSEGAFAHAAETKAFLNTLNLPKP